MQQTFRQACCRAGLAIVFAIIQAGAAEFESNTPWHELNYLAKGGYWPFRLPVVITNTGTNRIAGEGVNVPLDGLVGMRAEALRVVDRGGQELLFEVVNASGREKRQGRVEAKDQLVCPVVCGPYESVTNFIYAGNDAAIPVADYLHGERKYGECQVKVAKLEQLKLDPPVNGDSQFSSEWPLRAVVRVYNFGSRADGPVLVYADLRPTLGRRFKVTGDVAVRVYDPATRQPVPSSLRLDQGLLFSTMLPARAIHEYHVYLNPSRKVSPSESLAGYERLMQSAANLAPAPNFEAAAGAAAGWQFSGPGTVRHGVVQGGRFGAHCLQFTLPKDGPAPWTGWQSQPLPVRPGATYIYSGYLRAAGVAGTAVLHAHLHNAAGGLVESSPFVGTKQTVGGDSDWTQSATFVQTPPDARSIQLHLTMNAPGTLQHDGVLFCEVRRGEMVRLETADGPPAEAGLRVWSVNPLIKVFPDDPPGPPASRVDLECARNEYEPFQLAVFSDRPATQLAVTVSPLRNARGESLPPVKCERVAHVPIDHPSGYYQSQAPEWGRKLPQGAGATDGWAGLWPDPLRPAEPANLAARVNAPYWFTVRAWPETPPGEYQGEITFQASNVPPVSVPVKVQVLPFALPRQTQLAAIFDFRFGPGGVFKLGGLTEQARKRWLAFLAEHRLGIDSIEPTPTFKRADGQVTMDAEGFDAMARYCFDELGMSKAYTPWFFYAFGWAYPPKKFFNLEPFTPEYNAAWQQAWRLFSEHLKARGWHDKFVYYISDEPHFDHPFVVEQMRKLCELAHAVDPAIPIYASTWRHCPAWDNVLDLWGVGQYGCFPVAEMERLRRAGKHFWFTCDGQMATDTPYLATERLLPYYCHRYGATGFEFWGVSWWTYNPWERGWHTFIRQSDEGKKYYWIRYPNGDGYLAYPGEPMGLEGPVSTIRLEQVREGLEDYEALSVLSRLVDQARQSGRDPAVGTRALAQAAELVFIPNAGGLRSTEILPDPDRVLQVRQAVNEAIVALTPAP